METLQSNKPIRKETDTPVRYRVTEAQSAGREEARRSAGLRRCWQLARLEEVMEVETLGPSPPSNGLERHWTGYFQVRKDVR